jgi:hypothetical protein
MKSEGQTAEQQAAVLLHRGRERLARQRAMLVKRPPMERVIVARTTSTLPKRPQPMLATGRSHLALA